MAFPFGRRRKHVPVTWQQRAAAVVLTILTVIQTPLFSYKITYSDDSVRTRTWSLPEIVAVGLLRTNAESYAWYARAALMPGIFTRTALLQLDACVIQPSDACNWSALKDFDAMWALADYSDQVPVFVEQLGEYRQYMQAFAAMATVFSFSSIFKDGVMGLFLGYGGVMFLASRSGCDVNGGTVMCVVAVLTAYVMFSKAGEEEPAEAAPAAATAAVGAGSAVPLITPTKEAKKTK